MTPGCRDGGFRLDSIHLIHRLHHEICSGNAVAVLVLVGVVVGVEALGDLSERLHPDGVVVARQTENAL